MHRIGSIMSICETMKMKMRPFFITWDKNTLPVYYFLYLNPHIFLSRSGEGTKKKVLLFSSFENNRKWQSHVAPFGQKAAKIRSSGGPQDHSSGEGFDHGRQEARAKTKSFYTPR